MRWSKERIRRELDRLEDMLETETDEALRAMLIRDIDGLIHAMGPQL